jgi:uncharacterized SAM-binding protein YcdF (DUF218 family)
MRELLQTVTNPYPVLLLLVTLALANLWRKRRETPRRLLLVTVPFVVLVLVSIEPVAYLILGTLEWENPPLRARPDDAQAIVVLASGVRVPGPVRPHAELDERSLYRCIRAGALYHQGKACPVLVSGGKSDPSESGPPCADLMRDFLLSLGVKESDLIVEDESRSTYENALACRRLLEERGIHRIVLVTDAMHLVRATGCFRKQGLDVVPAGCHYNAQYSPRLAGFVPNANYLRYARSVTHEWTGIAWYWLCGRI